MPTACAWRLPDAGWALAAAAVRAPPLRRAEPRRRGARRGLGAVERHARAARGGGRRGLARPRVLRVLRRDRLLQAAARRRLADPLRARGARRAPRPALHRRRPPWSAGSWSSTAVATATSASTACPSRACSGRSAGPGPTWSAPRRRWRCPGEDPRRYLLHARQQLRPGRGERAARGRRGAQPPRADAPQRRATAPLPTAGRRVHLRFRADGARGPRPSSSGLRRARLGARAAGARAAGPPRRPGRARRWPRRAGGALGRRRPRQAHAAPPERAAAWPASRVVGGAAAGCSPAGPRSCRCWCSWPRPSGRRSPSTAPTASSSPWPPTAGWGGCCRSTSCSPPPGSRSAGARCAAPSVRAAAARAGAARRPRSSPSPSSRCCGRTTSRPARTCSPSSRCRSPRCSPSWRAPSSPTGRRARWRSRRSALASLFAAVGIWQAITHELFFYAPNLAVSNANTDFFRVTSLFGDPSLYGRHVVLGIGVVLVLLATSALATGLLLAALALMWAGPVVLLLAVEHGGAAARDARARARDRRSRRAARRGRARARRPPWSALGFARREGDRRRVGQPGHERPHRARGGRARRDPRASRSSAWGSAGSRGPAGILAGQRPAHGELRLAHDPAHGRRRAGRRRARALPLAAGRRRPRDRRRVPVGASALGLALGASLLALFVHALFYSGFLEDPLTWMVLAVAAGWSDAARSGRGGASRARPRTERAHGVSRCRATGERLGRLEALALLALLLAHRGRDASRAGIGPLALPARRDRPLRAAGPARARRRRGVGRGHRPRRGLHGRAALRGGGADAAARRAPGRAGAASRSCWRWACSWRPVHACSSSGCATPPRRGSSRTTRPTRSSRAETWCWTARTRTATTTASRGSSASTPATEACPSGCASARWRCATSPTSPARRSAPPPWRLLPEPFDDYRLLVLLATLATLGAALAFRAPLAWRLVIGAAAGVQPDGGALGLVRPERRRPACCSWCSRSRSSRARASAGRRRAWPWPCCSSSSRSWRCRSSR